MKMRHSYVIALAMLYGANAAALEAGDVTVSRDGGSYLTRLDFTVPASIDPITAILTDYEHPERLTPAISDRKVLSRRDGITRVRTDIHGCIVFFCKDLVLTQDVSISQGTINAAVVTEESDFRSGYVRWVMTSNAEGGTDIKYESVIAPDFFVPPLIGRYFVRKWLRGQVYEIAERLVAEALREADSPGAFRQCAGMELSSAVTGRPNVAGARGLPDSPVCSTTVMARNMVQPAPAPACCGIIANVSSTAATTNR